MDTTTKVKKFIDQHTDFEFNVLKYLLHIQSCEENQKKFDSFCANMLDSETNFERDYHFNLFKTGSSDIPALKYINELDNPAWKDLHYTDKEIIRVSNNEYINEHFEKEELWFKPTSGTTGKPTNTWYSDKLMTELQLFTVRKAIWVAGKLTEDITNREILLINILDNKYLSKEVLATPNGSVGFKLRLVFNESSAEDIKSICNDVLNFKPGVVTTKPNILATLLDYSKKNKINPFKNTGFIITSASNLSKSLRAEAEEYFEIDIFDCFGLSEVGIVASECKEKNGLHIYESKVLAEVLDENGNLSLTGTGELVVSSFNNETMPFLKYKTKDLVNITASEVCGCGLKTRKITQLSGRMINNFKFHNEIAFSPTHLKGLIPKFSIDEFQIIQTKTDEITINVELPKDGPENELSEIKKYAQKILLDTIGSAINVIVKEKTFKKEGKFERYLSQI